MARKSRQTPSVGQSVYEIRIQGGLDCHWSDWFDGLTVARDENDNTLLRGSIPDQAALRGVLLRIFDLGLVLLSVNRRRVYARSLTITAGICPAGQAAEDSAVPKDRAASMLWVARRYRENLNCTSSNDGDAGYQMPGIRR